MEETHKEKVVILHGFSKDQIYTVLRAVKNAIGSQEEIAFAMTTPHSLTLKLGDVVKDVAEEHAYMKKNPPHTQPPMSDS